MSFRKQVSFNNGLDTSIGTVSNLFTTNITSTNLNATNFTVVNFKVDNSTFGSIYSANINTTLLTAGTALVTRLSAGSATLGTLLATNITATNSTFTNILATTALLTNVSTTSLTATTALLTNASISNLTTGTLVSTNVSTTSLTVTTALLTNASISNLTTGTLVSTNVSISNLTATTALLTNASISNLTAGTLVSTNVSATSLTATTARLTNASIANLTTGTLVSTNVSTTSLTVTTALLTNASISNLTAGTLVSTNVSATSLTVTTALLTNVSISNLTTGALVSTNVSATSLTATTALLTNASISNLTTGTLVSTNVSATSLTATTALLTNASISNLTTGTLVSTNVSVSNLTATTALLTNASISNLTTGTLVSTNISSTSLTATTALLTNASISNLTTGTLVSTNISASNLTATTALLTNASISNLTTGTLVSTNVSATSLTVTTALLTNASISNLTTGTLVSTNVSTTSLTATNILATNETVTGALLAIGNSNTLGSIFTTGGNVGINNTAPNYRLDVNGDINFTGDLYENGSLFTTSQWTGSVGSALSYTSGTVIMTDTSVSNITVTNVLATNQTITGGLTATASANTVGAIITTGGNVGIGITPSQKLHLYDANTGSTLILAGFASGESNNGIWFHLDDSLGLNRVKSKILAVGSGSFGRSNLHICLNGANDGNSASLLDTRLIIQDSGNVGIGTSSPSQIFQVGDGARLRISNDATDYSLIGTKTIDDSNNTRIVISGQQRGVQPGNIEYIATTMGSHIFYNQGGNVTAMTIVSSGNVGIGTASPNSRLHVVGDTTNIGGIIAEFRNNNNSERIRILDEISGFPTMIESPTGNGLGFNSGTLKFFTSSTTERMRITNTGNVGIGTESPNFTLTVNGTIGANSITTGALAATNISVTNLVATNETVVNLTVTNETVQNLIIAEDLLVTDLSSSNATVTNALITNLSATNLAFTAVSAGSATATIGTLVSNNINVTALTAASELVTNLSATNLAFTAVSAGSATATIGTVVSNNINVTALTAASELVTNLSATNLAFTAVSAGSATATIGTVVSNNINVTALTAASELVTNLSATNLAFTAVSAGSATATIGTLVSNNINVTALTAASELVTNLSATNLAFTAVSAGSATATIGTLVSNNINVTSLTAASELVTNLSATNLAFTSVSAGSATATIGTVVSSNINVTSLTGSTALLTDVSSTNITTTNILITHGTVTGDLLITGNSLKAISNSNTVGTIFTTGGNVGIANTAPNYRLDVNGDINFTGDLYENGSLFTTSQWTGSVGSALSYTSGTVIMTNASVSNMTATNILATNLSTGAIRNANEIAIGSNTNLPFDVPTPLAPLDIVAKPSKNNAVAAFQYPSGGGFRHWITSRHNTGSNNGNAIDFYLNTGNDNADSSTPGTNNQQVMTIAGLGVGIGNTAPSYTLDVTGTIGANSITTGQLAATNISVTNLVATNETVVNLTVTNETVQNLIIADDLLVTDLSSSNATITNTLITNLSATNLTFTTVSAGSATATIGTVVATNIATTNETVSSLLATSASATNLAFTTVSAGSATATIGTLVSNNINVTALTAGSELVTNLSATNLAFSTVSAGSATATIGTLVSNNINVTALTAASELVTNLSATNLAFSTVSAGSATATIGTLVSNNINVTSLTAGSELVTNLSATNLAFTAVSAGSATATIGSIMSTNINVTALTSSTALITNMSSTNITTTNILITHGTVTGDLLITGNSLKAISNSNTVGAIITTGGNVGIANTAPNYRLDVNGDINFTGDLYENGSLFTTSQWTGSVGSALSYTSGTVIMTNTSISNITVTNILATNETITGGLLITGGSLKATANDNTVGPIITTFTTTTFANLVPVTSGLLAYYNGSSWTGSQWSDLTTNGNNATVISGTINTTTENSVTYLYGGTSAYIQFPAGILPTTYTLFHIAKYNGANKGRIIRDDNTNPNWLSGFWSGKSEVVYHDGDAIGSNGNLGFGVSNSTNWVLSTDKRTSYRANGNFTATINNGANANVLSVNGSGEESDWAVSEIIVYNRELTTDEVERMESWLMDKYSAFTFTTAVTYPSAYTAGSVSVGTYGNIGLFVGISNTAPSYTLDVNGDINFTGDLYENGSLFTTSQWTGSVGSALSYTSGTVIITNSSIQNMTATNILATNLSTGTIRNNSEIAVGLELNNFIVPTPLAPLDVVAKPSKNNSVVAFQYPYGGGFRHWITARHNTGSNNGNAIDFYLNTGNDNGDSSTPGTGNQHVMTIAGLGVGIGNTSPNYTLDVTGTLGAVAVTTGALAATNISVTNLVATNETVVNLVTTYETVTNLLIADDIRVTDLTSSNSNLTAITAGGITVTSGGLNATFNSNTIGPIVTTGGNVGIGNTAPSYDLDVTGDVNLTGTLYQNGVPFTGASQWTGNIGSTISYTSGNVNVVTATFTTAGNVGISNTSPSYDLDVTGDINFTGDLYKNGTVIRLSPSYITRSAQTIGSQTISAGSNILLFPDAGQTTNDITYNTSGTFTVNKDGLYSVFVDVDTYNAVDVVDLYILKNNTEDSVNGRIAWVNNSGDDAVSINAMVYLAENDYITVNLTYSATSGSFTTPYAGSKVNSFAMSLLNVGSTTVRNSQWIGDIGSDVSYTSGNVLMNDVTVSNVLITNATVTGTILILGNSLKAVSNSNTIGNIITTGGNVGIGTVSPNSRLHVVGETTNAGGIIAEFRNNANSDRIRIIDENGATGLPPSIVSPTGSGLGFDAGTLRFFTPHLSTTASMIITSSRNVGIGTTSPSFTLDVNGTIGANAITTGTLAATNISVSNLVATNETVVNLITTFETVTNLLIADDIRVTDLTSSNSNFTSVTAGGIVVTAGGLTATASANTIGNIFTTGGNVGIGTTAPSLKFQVSNVNSNTDTAVFTSNATFGTVIQINATHTNGRNFKIQSTASGDGSTPSGGLVIDDASAGARRFVIGSTGNVGIAVNNPTERLNINGNILFVTGGSLVFPDSAGAAGAGNGSWIYNQADELVISNRNSGNGVIQFRVGASERMRINNVGRVGIGTTSPSFQLQLSIDSAGKPNGGSWANSSDERLKENITTANLDICYNIIKTLPLKRYRWKDNSYTDEQIKDRNVIGWIAQDVQSVFPKAVEQSIFFNVDGTTIGNCLTLNETMIIRTLYGAVQKLITDKENLEDELQTATLELQTTQTELQSLKTFLQSKYPGEI